MKETQTFQEFDIMIIGGGITGSTTSILLQKAGYSTIVIDKSDLTKFKHGESIAPKCKKYFESLGVFFENSGAVEYFGINSIWGHNDIVCSDFIFNPYGNGLVVDRRIFEKKLIDEAIKLGSSINLSNEIKEINFENYFWKVKVRNIKEVKTFRVRLIVIATGRNSFQKINTCKIIYYDKLISFSKIQNQRSTHTKEQHLAVEALPNGWFYSNNLPDKKAILTFLTDYDTIPKEKNKMDFVTEQVHQTSWCKNQGVLLTGEFIVGDARTRWLETQSGKGWLRLGDCAYTIDPLSGQGILKNFEMTLYFVENIKYFIDHDKIINKNYSDYNRQDFNRYLYQGVNVYNREQRWSGKSFWKVRNDLILNI